LSKDPPGAGSYNPEIPKTGTSKSFAGGPERKGAKPNGVPGPGSHYPEHPKEAPLWGMGPKSLNGKDGDAAREGKPLPDKRDKSEWMANLGPGTHNPVHVTHTQKSAPFSMTAKGGKGPAVEDPNSDISKKIRTVQEKKNNQV